MRDASPFSVYKERKNMSKRTWKTAEEIAELMSCDRECCPKNVAGICTDKKQILRVGGRGEKQE